MKRFKEQLKSRLAGTLPNELLELLPSGFQRVGDVVILGLKPELLEHERGIGVAVLKLLPENKTVCARFGGVSGDLRIPGVKKIAGNGTTTVHTENGCKYGLDVTKVMFAKGNVGERARLPRLVRHGETIIDMFAGIGYFTVPVAKKSRPCVVYAIEKNPESVRFLKENLKLNGITGVEVIEADNRDAGLHKLNNAADRVIMGYLPGTEKFLPAAFGFLKQDGGIIHFHNTYRKQELWETPRSELEAAAMCTGYKLDSISYRGIVKHFAPGVEHVVIDAHFSRAS